MTSPPSPDCPDTWLGPFLVESGLIAREQLQALSQGLTGRLWTAAVASGQVADQDIVAALAKRYKSPIANLSEADSAKATVLPEGVARRHHVVALGLDDRTVRIGTSDPRDLEAEQALGFITGRTVHFEIAAPAGIAERLDELYRPENAINRLLRGLEPTSVQVETQLQEDDRDPALDAPMSKLVDAMIADAVRAGASDIHSEVDGANLTVRYRVDGILREVMRLPEAAGPSLVRRVKIIAGLDVTNSMTPQDGRSTARVDGNQVDLRIATAPVARKGEKLVIRILNKSNLKSSVADLALPPEESEVLLRMLGNREGMVLVTGPTGSGKTTTLYAVLNHLRTGKVNIVTVEDPVEYDVDGISQMQVNDAQGFTFATALRSVLRQDPDIVLVGEIRDGETATIAIQAGLTGHFVFSTLHTNDAVSAVVRLRDMGIDSFKIASVLKGILAQRLVRRLCSKCAEAVPLEEIPVDVRPPEGYPGIFAPKRPVGCKACAGSGYHGRLAVMEMLPVEGDVPKLIEVGAPPQAILDAAKPHGLRTLWESGLIRFWSGMTSYAEVYRVLGEMQEHQEGHASKGVSGNVPLPSRGADDRLTILLADDDAQMRRLVKSVLERDGFRVLEAADGLDALDIVSQHHLDLVILDQDMPRLTGLGVLEELRAQFGTAGTPIIMLTARTDDTESQAFELGAQDYLTKPFQPRSLLARVKAVLKRTTME